METEPTYTDIVEIDLSTIEPCMAGPSRPNQKTPLSKIPDNFNATLVEMRGTTQKKKLFTLPERTLNWVMAIL